MIYLKSISREKLQWLNFFKSSKLTEKHFSNFKIQGTKPPCTPFGTTMQTRILSTHTANHGLPAVNELACPTNFVCATGTQISSSAFAPTMQMCLDSASAAIIQNCLSSGSVSTAHLTVSHALPLLCSVILQDSIVDFVWCRVFTFFRLLMFRC